MCPHYDDCLTKAALSETDALRPPQLGCNSCRHRRDRVEAGDLPAADLEACYRLLAALFKPDLLPWGKDQDDEQTEKAA